MQLPTLYSIDTKGKVRQWDCWTEFDTVIVSHGVMGGKMQEKRTICKPKNVGRANATTPEEQAAAEAHSKWTQQVEREDYAESPDDAGKQLRPMLAHDFHKVPHRVVWNDVCCQPKLDGLRLLAGHRWLDRPCSFEIMSRKGDSYDLPHLHDAAEDLLTLVNEALDELTDGKTRCQALDGEVYIHGMPLPTITSLARRYQKNETEKLDYYLFDLVIPGFTFQERYVVLKEALSMFDHPSLKLVPLHGMYGKTDMEAMHGKYVEDGYEGLMIRHRKGQYKIGRSADLFKFKLFFDEEVKITGVWEDKNGNAMLACKRRNGVELDVTPKRTHEERKALLGKEDELVGKWLTVKYQATTPDGSLQFPVGLAIRECDENGQPIL